MSIISLEVVPVLERTLIELLEGSQRGLESERMIRCERWIKGRKKVGELGV